MPTNLLQPAAGHLLLVDLFDPRYSLMAVAENEWPQTELRGIFGSKMNQGETILWRKYTHEGSGLSMITNESGHLKSCVTPPMIKSSSSDSSPSSAVNFIICLADKGRIDVYRSVSVLSSEE